MSISDKLAGLNFAALQSGKKRIRNKTLARQFMRLKAMYIPD